MKPYTHCYPSLPSDRPLLTIQQFHRRLGGSIGINALRAAVNEGRIISIRIGQRKRLIPASELHDWPTREAQKPS